MRFFQRAYKCLLNQDKAVNITVFEEELFERARKKSRRNTLGRNGLVIFTSFRMKINLDAGKLKMSPIPVKELP